LKKNTLKATVSVKRYKREDETDTQRRQSSSLAYVIFIILLSLA